MSSIVDLAHLEHIWKNGDACVMTHHGKRIQWSGFLEKVNDLSSRLSDHPAPSWILFSEEPSSFAIAYLALLHAGKQIHLHGIRPKKQPEGTGLPILSDIPAISEMPVEQEGAGYRPFLKGKTGLAETMTIFHTSGSTGQPKQVIKHMYQIENELKTLHALWGEMFKGARVFTTVSHQHFYGLLFSILLPLTLAAEIGGKKVEYPESLSQLNSKKIVLVSSPAFLKRMDGFQEPLRNQNGSFTVFSSGGFLPACTAEFCRRFFHGDVREIYGSTETGGIAWRNSPMDPLWTPFDCVSVSSHENGTLLVQSPYLEDNESYNLDDCVEILEHGKINLKGRMDSIVKIEDKRVALGDIENRILETGLVNDTAALSLEGKRQFIAIIIDLNQAGEKKFEGLNKREIIRFFRLFLGQYFHPIVLPKKWRCPAKVPRNSLGKMIRSEAVSLFKPASAAGEPPSENWVETPEILNLTVERNVWLYHMFFHDTYRYFDGHFEEIKILPAVAQMDWVLNTLSDTLGVQLNMKGIPRFKLKNPIFPNVPVMVKIKYNKEKAQVLFEYFDPESQELFSHGNIILDVVA